MKGASRARPLSLSPTALKLYVRCAYAYALDKIVKVPGYRRIIAAHLHTGRAVHTVLEQLVRQEQIRPEDAVSSLERTFSWGAYTDRQTAEAAFQTARARLDAWVGTPYGWGAGEQLAVEKMLRTRPRPLGSASIGSVVLIGKPDLVRVDPEGTLEVVDHKSGKPGDGVEALKRDFQAAIYRILAEERWPDYSAYRVSFSYLATGTVIGLTYTREEVEDWWQALLTVAERIARARLAVENDIALEEAFVPAPGEQCAACTFRRVCAFRAS
ncbi:RecB family exonuclease [Gloeobacter violaceus]|uniref:Glr1745 protein n=1 Tax=Gloeobacter violaceus (strain ATCC 29082 / PCC 7421) TaxID=251221 RepID=Q7NJT7_GLOVI|nr:PD-(D/E)XK nuclease family protein [Gloeobacter violaceus]BAC89686.1 glr1745 [Gloeobacter violaceus PCC 7421]